MPKQDTSWISESTPVRKLPITPIPPAPAPAPAPPAPETARETTETEDVLENSARALLAKVAADSGAPPPARPAPATPSAAKTVPPTPATTPVLPLTPAPTKEFSDAPVAPASPAPATPTPAEKKKRGRRLSSPLSKMLSSKKKKSADAEPLSPGSRRKKSLVNSAIKGMKNATGLRKKTDPALKKIAADISVDVPPDGPSFSVPSPLTVPPEAAVEAKDEVLAKLAPAEPAPESFLSALQQYFPKLNLTCCVQPAPGERVLASQ
mmetsp:Transcript_24722/g.74192  ORF Transcript_24722/g.74192 Transcript_24722/m.74192 type:complete len:265 (-) Transcript_24722:60-854(-)